MGTIHSKNPWSRDIYKLTDAQMITQFSSFFSHYAFNFFFRFLLFFLFFFFHSPECLSIFSIQSVLKNPQVLGGVYINSEKRLRA